MSRSQGEGAHIIGKARSGRGHVVGQAAEAGLTLTLPLLPQHNETQDLLRTRLVRENHDVIAVGVGREETIDRMGRHQLLLDDSPQ